MSSYPSKLDRFLNGNYETTGRPDENCEIENTREYFLYASIKIC